MHKDDIVKYIQWKAGGREVGRCNVVSTSWATPERRPGVTKTVPGQGRREGEGAPRWDYSHYTEDSPAELSLQPCYHSTVLCVPLSLSLITAPRSGNVEWLSKTPGRVRQK